MDITFFLVWRGALALARGRTALRRGKWAVGALQIYVCDSVRAHSIHLVTTGVGLAQVEPGPVLG